MSTLTKQQKVEKATAIFKEYITATYDVESLAEKLDRACRLLGRYMIEDPEVSGGHNRSEPFLVLCELRAIMELKEPV